jgi:hypothetical protein
MVTLLFFFIFKFELRFSVGLAPYMIAWIFLHYLMFKPILSDLEDLALQRKKFWMFAGLFFCLNLSMLRWNILCGLIIALFIKVCGIFKLKLFKETDFKRVAFSFNTRIVSKEFCRLLFFINFIGWVFPSFLEIYRDRFYDVFSFQRDLLNVHKEKESLITLMFLSAPRPNNASVLLNALDSYLPILSQSQENLVRSRINAVVVNFKANHIVFNAAKSLFAKKGISFEKLPDPFEKDVKFFESLGSVRHRRQSVHFASALEFSMKFDSYYVLLLEDDFELCAESYHEIQKLIIAANSGFHASHCSIFIGTGGSGFLIRHDVIPILVKLLVIFLFEKYRVLILLL